MVLIIPVWVWNRRFPCGKRGLKYRGRASGFCSPPRRFPCGKRGLKSFVHTHIPGTILSLPLREAWIEITGFQGLKRMLQGRFPCGKRGLKCRQTGARRFRKMSLPLREAWIEIDGTVTYIMLPRSLPLREAWIEIEFVKSKMKYAVMSLPLREAWIEIP